MAKEKDKTLHDLAVLMCKAEGGVKQVDVAQMTETLSKLALVLQLEDDWNHVLWLAGRKKSKKLLKELLT